MNPEIVVLFFTAIAVLGQLFFPVNKDIEED
jgi:hypothetical protein